MSGERYWLERDKDVLKRGKLLDDFQSWSIDWAFMQKKCWVELNLLSIGSYSSWLLPGGQTFSAKCRSCPENDGKVTHRCFFENIKPHERQHGRIWKKSCRKGIASSKIHLNRKANFGAVGNSKHSETQMISRIHCQKWIKLNSRLFKLLTMVFY